MDNASTSTMYLSLGMASGALSHPYVFAALVHALRTESVRMEYIVYLRDALTKAIEQSKEP